MFDPSSTFADDDGCLERDYTFTANLRRLTGIVRCCPAARISSGTRCLQWFSAASWVHLSPIYHSPGLAGRCSCSHLWPHSSSWNLRLQDTSRKRSMFYIQACRSTIPPSVSLLHYSNTNLLILRPRTVVPSFDYFWQYWQDYGRSNNFNHI